MSCCRVADAKVVQCLRISRPGPWTGTYCAYCGSANIGSLLDRSSRRWWPVHSTDARVYGLASGSRQDDQADHAEDAVDRDAAGVVLAIQIEVSHRKSLMGRSHEISACAGWKEAPTEQCRRCPAAYFRN